MIAPQMIGDAALIARFSRVPGALRAALASEADRLARVLRDRVARPAAGNPLSLAVESTTDGVTLTITRRRGPAVQSPPATGPQAGRTSVAPRHPRPHRFFRPAAAPAEPPGLSGAFIAMGPEVRAGLETAFRRVLVR